MRPTLTSPHKHYLLYGTSLAALLLVVKWLEVRYTVVDTAMDVYSGAIALLFMALGIWVAAKLMKPGVKTIVVEKEIYIEVPAAPQVVVAPFVASENVMAQTGISNRELQVLQLMALGQSNQEIAGHLFVSLNTVKTHTSSIFSKLDVNRRTQAVDKARKLGLVS